MKAGKKAFLGLATVSAAVLIHAGSAQALVASPDVFGLDFRFNNPGARANAMGGAFIGLADDATAAYTNPAGLTVLTKPEVSVEYKAGDYTTKIMDRIGTTDYDKTASGLSFISYAYPAKNTTVTIFRHQLMNAKADFTWHEVDTYDPDPANWTNQESYISADTQINTIGVGLGTKLNDKLSLGLAVGLAQLDYKTTTFRYTEVGGILTPNSKEVGDSSDNAEQYTLSLLWNVAGELNLGLVYRQGPKFTISKSTWEFDPTANDGYGAWRGLRYQSESEFKVPDVYGLGLSYRFEPNLTVAVDASYVKYSQLIAEFIGDENSTFQLTQMDGFNLDDEYEFRLGLEYVLDVAGSPVALRGGYYYRPDHRVYYTGNTAKINAGNYLAKDKDEHIGSLGLGFLINPNLQVDLAASTGRLSTEGIASVVYRFE